MRTTEQLLATGAMFVLAGAIHAQVTFTEVTGTPFENVETSSIAFADVDGMNGPDVLITGTDDSGQPISKLYTNDGSGNFTEVTGTPIEGVWLSSIAFADVDGDTDQDLLITGSNAQFALTPIAKLYTNDGSGNFTEVTGTPFVGVQGGSIAFADVDGDTDQDVLITGDDALGFGAAKLYSNDGSGNFTEVTGTPFEGVDQSSIAFADVDGMNGLDVLITGRGDLHQPLSKLYTNDGSGNFAEVTGTPFDGVGLSSIAFADVDGMNGLDVLITGATDVNAQTSIIKLYTNDGSGNFTEVTGTPFEGVVQGSIAFADVDGVNGPDVLITGENSSSAEIAKLYTNDGSGNFTEVTATPFDGVGLSSIAFADVAGMNGPDVLITGRNNSGDRTTKLYTNNLVAPAANELKLEISTDNNGNQTTWQLRNGGTNTVVASGGPYANNMNTIETIMVPNGCYELEVFDSGNDGICCASGSGNFALRTAAGQRIVISDGTFTSSAKAPSPFCLPMGTDKLITSRCDKLDYLPNDFMIAFGNPDVAAQYNVNNTNSGYQFWMYALDGSYNRFIFFSHANPVNGAPPNSPMAAGHLRFSAIGTLPVPQGKFLNVRVRGRVNGTYKDFGPACSFKLLGAPPACPLTQLLDNTNSPNHSCGVTKAFGKSDKLVAKPVPGANRYRFRFEAQGSSFVRNISPSGYALGLKWTTLPLQNGTTYNVKVAISKDGGTTYCPYGQTCTVMIVNPPVAPTDRSLFDTAERAITLFPNPNNGEELNINLRVVDPDIDMVLVRIIDPLGRTVHTKNVSTGPGTTDRSISLANMELSSGTYIVQLTAGEETFTERLVRQ